MDHAQISWEFLVFQAEQMTDFLGFCRHSCNVAKSIHWMVPKFPRNSWDLDGSCTNGLGISSVSAEQMPDFLGFCRCCKVYSLDGPHMS